MQQSSLQIEMLSWHHDHIKRPQYFGYEQLSLHPGHFPSHAGPWAKAEGVEAFGVIVRECCIVQRMLGGEPALRSEAQWIVVEARTAG